MKKVLFWVLYIPCGTLMIALNLVAGLFEMLANKYNDALHRYENWVFDDKK